jgi:hypothetical protein
LGSLLHEPSHEIPQWLFFFLLAVVQIWCFSSCVVEHLKCLHELCLEIYPTVNWVWRQQGVPIQYWSFASNDEGFGQCNIIPSCWIHSWFISHEELPRVSEAVIFRERDGLELRRPRCRLQPNRQRRLRIHEVWDSVSCEEVFFWGFSCWPRVLVRLFLPRGTVLLFFHLIDFSLYHFNLFFCFV